MLAIPDIRQAADYDCGDAVVDAVCRFYGLAGRSRLSNGVQGLSPDTLEAALRARNLKVLGPMTLPDLKHLTKDRPVICPTAIQGGHWLVVRGVTAKRVYFHDPASGVFHLPHESWIDNWRDVSRSGYEYDRWGICAWSNV